MKLGLYGLHRGSSAEPETLHRRARLAEDAGFESLWVGDHVALPFGGADPPDEPRLEAVVALSHLAAVTSRVRLAFGLLVLPQRQPVLLAKQVSSIDVLSKGRLIVGIGVGYVEPELRALGASLADRGARTDEYLWRCARCGMSPHLGSKGASFRSPTSSSGHARSSNRTRQS